MLSAEMIPRFVPASTYSSAADRDVERSTSSQVSVVAQGDLVGLGDVVGLDGSKSFTQAFAGLPQEFEGVGSRTLRGSAIRICAMLLDQVRLKGCSDFIGCFEGLVDGPIHAAVRMNDSLSAVDG